MTAVEAFHGKPQCWLGKTRNEDPSSGPYYDVQMKRESKYSNVAKISSQLVFTSSDIRLRVNFGNTVEEELDMGV